MGDQIYCHPNMVVSLQSVSSKYSSVILLKEEDEDEHAHEPVCQKKGPLLLHYTVVEQVGELTTEGAFKSLTDTLHCYKAQQTCQGGHKQ